MTITLPQVKHPAGITATAIEWTDFAFNPLRAIDRETGKVGWHCVPVAPGCANCYAATINRRFGTGLDYAAQNGKRVEVVIDEQRIEAALKWKPPRKFVSRGGAGHPTMVFVCDMTDLFGEWVSFETIDRIMAVFALRPDVIWQVLTKRPARAAEYLCDARRDEAVWDAQGAMGAAPSERAVCGPLPNLWLGCSVSNQKTADAAIPHLLRCPAAVRFISYEPALAPLSLCDAARDWIRPLRSMVQGNPPICSGVQWVIVGGESGPGARPFDAAWARSTIQQCREAGVPVFVKQVGANCHDTESGILGRSAPWEGELAPTHTRRRHPKGGDMSEWPADLRVREWPTGAATPAVRAGPL